MTSFELTTNIRSFCAQNANPENVKKYSNFFKDEYIAYGLTQPQINIKVKELSSLKNLKLETVFEAIPELFASGKYEEISFGLLLIDGFHKQFTADTFRKIEQLFPIGITNWAHADTLGMFILPKFMKKQLVQTDDFGSWLTSSYKFQRRCVPVTLIKSLKENKTADFAQFFSFIEPLMTDPEREVHQGVGWFLREAWKIQPQVTEIFLLKWKDTTARLIVQYATEKMDKNYRLRFRKEKK